MNVYEAAKKRIAYLFDSFDYVYVSFSGGKDSGILLNMALEEAKRRGRILGVLHLDYEAQYQLTTDYVDEMLSSPGLDVWRCCVPFKAHTCTSMTQAYWRPWDPSKKNIWVRPMPKNGKSDFPFFRENMWDYDFQTKFGEWMSKEKRCSVCCMVGIRTQESLNRWRAIYSDRNYKKFDGKAWTKDMENGVVNAYPIYDFTTEDVWIANTRSGWKYNKLYDLYYMAGLGIEQMRVASPFISEGQETLHLYQVIEPETWGKMLGRVNGVNFVGIYGGTTAMGWKSITLPEGHTWESFMYFLLKTLPKKTREQYLGKLETSIKFWREKGGCLSSETIKKLQSAGVNIEVSDNTNYKTDKRPVRMDYLDDIDIAEFKEIPTYKRMCICIIKNDHLCKYMGFSQTKNEMQRRKYIIEKYKALL